MPRYPLRSASFNTLGVCTKIGLFLHSMITKIIGSIASRSQWFRRELLTIQQWHSEEIAYTRLAENGFSPGSIIDIGANNGSWSRLIRKVFEKNLILMIEARAEEEKALKNTCQDLLNANYIISLLGSSGQEKVSFSVHGSGSSIFSELSNAPRSFSNLKMKTLDEITSELHLNDPIFLKLDVQGAELEVLKGAANILTRSEVVQLEVALLDYNQGAPTFADVVTFMDKRNYHVFDIAGFIKPNKIDLSHIDVLFVQRSSKLRDVKFVF